MDTINQLLSQESPLYYPSARKLYLKFNLESKYVPLYCINKIHCAIKNKYRFEYPYEVKKKQVYKTLTQGTNYGGLQKNFLNFLTLKEEQSFKKQEWRAEHKEALKSNITQNLEEQLDFYTSDSGTYSQRNSFKILQRISLKREQSTQYAFIRDLNKEFIFGYNFLADKQKGIILFTVVLKREHLLEAKLLLYLNREIPKEYFQLWFRKDFMNPEYKYYFAKFKSEILNPCLKDEIDVCILDNFNSMFLNKSIPKRLSLGKYKELMQGKAQEAMQKEKQRLYPKEVLKVKNKVEEGVDLPW